MNQSIHDRIMSRSQDSGMAAKAAQQSDNPKRSLIKAALFCVLGIAVAGAIGYGLVRFDAIANFVSQPAVAETNGAQGGDTPFAQHAKQAGINTCSTVFPVLGGLLTNGAQYSIQSSWNADQPNDHAVQALVGMDFATNNYKGPAAGIVHAAPTSSGCEGAMIRVAPFSNSCADIPAMLPQNSKLSNNLGQVAVYSLGNNSGDALLLPNGNSCIVVSVAAAAKAGS